MASHESHGQAGRVRCNSCIVVHVAFIYQFPFSFLCYDAESVNYIV